VVKKTAQSLWHHNFATVHHRDMRFSAKCSEINSLHDQSQCLITAIKYFFVLPLESELLKNRITFNVPWSIKTCHYYFSVSPWNIGRFQYFLACDIKNKLDAKVCSFGHLTLTLSLHYRVKRRSRCLAIDNNEFLSGSVCVGSEII